MIEPTTLDQIAHGTPYEVRGFSLARFREFLQSLPGAPHFRFGDDAAIVLIGSPGPNTAPHTDDLDDACTNLIRKITEWRGQVRQLDAKPEAEAKAVRELDLAVARLAQTIDQFVIRRVVDHRRRKPLPPGGSSAPGCPMCGSHDEQRVFSARVLPTRGRLKSYKSFEKAGETSNARVWCTRCERSYPLRAAQAVAVLTDMDSRGVLDQLNALITSLEADPPSERWLDELHKVSALARKRGISQIKFMKCLLGLIDAHPERRLFDAVLRILFPPKPTLNRSDEASFGTSNK